LSVAMFKFVNLEPYHCYFRGFDPLLDTHAFTPHHYFSDLVAIELYSYFDFHRLNVFDVTVPIHFIPFRLFFGLG
jgi:hypothetical protein